MSAEPIVETRTRHENRSPLSSSKTRELLFSAGAIGIGALGGYMAVDYIIKSQMIERFLSSIGVKINPGNTVPAGTDTQGDNTAAVAMINFSSTLDTGKRPAEIFDRTTRVNSYAARKFNRKPSPVVEGGIDITQFQAGVPPQPNEINQIVTDDDVYDSF